VTDARDHPTFAIVGHPNKGKSSIVATLAEDDSVPISPDPGTTTEARSFMLSVDGQTLYELIDTPGFQRPRAVLEWLMERERGAGSRPAAVRDFVAAHTGDARFHDECELLRPIVDGAGVLYVVDGAHPYGSEYEAEMEILRRTGQPRMALINMIGDGNYADAWRTALDQYFSLVRVFDAQHADFDKRIELLRAFGELAHGREGWQAALERAVRALSDQRAERRRRAAAEIADLLIDTLSARQSVRVPATAWTEDRQSETKAQLIDRLEARLRRRERQARRMIADIYRHPALHVEWAGEPAILADDLFTGRTFNAFGLSPGQLALTGAATGAAAGGAIDLAVGGASLLLGAGAGAVLGGAGALLGARRLARVKVLGPAVGGWDVRVGPVTQANFPWVVLGRALLHQRLVAERNHARREALTLEAGAGAHLADSLDAGARRRLAAVFRKIRRGGLDAAGRQRFAAEIEACLAP
jgi:hypothetical protein